MSEQPAEVSLPWGTKRTTGSRVRRRLFESRSVYGPLELDPDCHIAHLAVTGDTREVSDQMGTSRDVVCPQTLDTSLHRAASCTRRQCCIDTASTSGLEGKSEQPTDSSAPPVKQKMKRSRRYGRLHRPNVFPPIALVAVDRNTAEVLEHNEGSLTQASPQPIDPSPHLATELDPLQPSAGTASSSGLEEMSKQPAETSSPRSIVRKRLFVARKEDEQRHRKSERRIALPAANRIKREVLDSIESSRDVVCPRPIDPSPHMARVQDLLRSSTVTASALDSDGVSSPAADTSLPPKKKYDIRNMTRRGLHAATIRAEHEQRHLDSRIALLITNNNTSEVLDSIRISSDFVDPRPIDSALPREQKLRDLADLANNTKTQGFARGLLAVVGARRIDEMLEETGMNREVGGPGQPPPPTEPMSLPIDYKNQKTLRKARRDARYDSEVGKILRGLASNRKFGAPRPLPPSVTSRPILLMSGRAHDKATKDSKFTLSVISKEVFCTETSSKFDLFIVEPRPEPQPLNPSAPVFVPWSRRAKLPKRPKTKLERIVAGGLLEVRKDDNKSWFIRAWLDGHPDEWADSKKDREDGSIVGQSEVCMWNNDVGAEYDVAWLSR